MDLAVGDIADDALDDAARALDASTTLGQVVVSVSNHVLGHVRRAAEVREEHEVRVRLPPALAHRVCVLTEAHAPETLRLDPRDAIVHGRQRDLVRVLHAEERAYLRRAELRAQVLTEGRLRVLRVVVDRAGVIRESAIVARLSDQPVHVNQPVAPVRVRDRRDVAVEARVVLGLLLVAEGVARAIGLQRDPLDRVRLRLRAEAELGILIPVIVEVVEALARVRIACVGDRGGVGHDHLHARRVQGIVHPLQRRDPLMHLSGSEPADVVAIAPVRLVLATDGHDRAVEVRHRHVLAEVQQVGREFADPLDVLRAVEVPLPVVDQVVHRRHGRLARGECRGGHDRQRQ